MRINALIGSFITLLITGLIGFICFYDKDFLAIFTRTYKKLH